MVSDPDKHINAISLSSLIDSLTRLVAREKNQKVPVAFRNLSAISVGPLVPVPDSGGHDSSSATSSIILSSRVNLLSSWNGLGPASRRRDTISPLL